jgi:hypothetical protein
MNKQSSTPAAPDDNHLTQHETAIFLALENATIALMQATAATATALDAARQLMHTQIQPVNPTHTELNPNTPFPI